MIRRISSIATDFGGSPDDFRAVLFGECANFGIVSRDDEAINQGRL